MRGEHHRQEVAALYSSAREGVVRYLITAGVAPDAAEEAAQEAFLRLYIALRDGEEIRQARAWVYKVARNIAINTGRRDAAKSSFSEAMEVPSTELGAEERLLEREWMEGFYNAIQHLSERQRICLELRAQGLRYR